MPRLEPLVAPFSPDVDRTLRAMMPPGIEPLALFRTFALNPAMADAMHTWGSYELSRRLSVGIREREIVIDRTCARCGCEYEWGVHVSYFASRAQLTDGQIASIAHGLASDGCWTSTRDRMLIRLVDELHDIGDVTDDLWDQLRQEFDDGQLLDLIALCGWYHAVSFIARAARVTPEPGAARFADWPPSEAGA